MPPVVGTDISEAARRLRAGGLVAIPTETVYGLAANARDENAVADLYRLKGRPPAHPVIVHAAEFFPAAEEWASDIPQIARKLSARFMPGPLTLILPRHPHSPSAPAGGGDGIALRVPSHPVARALLTEFNGPLAAPSANRFGRISPTSAAHVSDDFPDADIYILDGGDCLSGLESAVVDCRIPAVLRPGFISEEEIAKAAGVSLLPPPQNARAPGTLPSHYAPQTPLRLVSPSELRDLAKGKNIAAYSEVCPPEVSEQKWRHAEPDPLLRGKNLYRNLRELDSSGADLILAEHPPEGAKWRAIRDRLTRASARN